MSLSLSAKQANRIRTEHAGHWNSRGRLKQTGWLLWAQVAAWFLLLAPLQPNAAGLPAAFPGVEVLEHRVGNTTVVSLRNTNLAEITASVEFALDNVTLSARTPVEVVLAPRHTTPPLISLRPIDASQPWYYTWRSYFTWGTPKARHDTNQIYRLPFAPGQAFRVVQGHDGTFSHTGEDRYAIDFGMPEATPVMAARDGLVVLARDGFGTGSPAPDKKKSANLVLLRHSDGTLGEYLHLLKGGIKVKCGDVVRAGQMLALSGNSGYTQGPHLHFMVFRAKNSKTRESFPIRFLTDQGSGLTLEEGERYAAPGTAGGWRAKPPR